MKIHPIKMSWYQDRRAVEPRALQANYEPAMGALFFNDNQVTEAPNPRHSSLTAELIIVHLKFTTNSSAKLILISLLLTHFIFHMRWSVMWWKMRSRTRNFLALLQCKWSFYRRFNYTGAALKSTRSQKVSVSEILQHWAQLCRFKSARFFCLCVSDVGRRLKLVIGTSIPFTFAK